MTQCCSGMLKSNRGMDMVYSRLSKLASLWTQKGTNGRESFLMVVGCITSFFVKLAVNFVCFDVTSRVDINCARSFFCQAPQLSRERIGTEIRCSLVGVSRETDFISRIEKPEHSNEYHTFIYVSIYILLYIQCIHCQNCFSSANLVSEIYQKF